MTILNKDSREAGSNTDSHEVEVGDDYIIPILIAHGCVLWMVAQKITDERLYRVCAKPGFSQPYEGKDADRAQLSIEAQSAPLQAGVDSSSLGAMKAVILMLTTEGFHKSRECMGMIMITIGLLDQQSEAPVPSEGDVLDFLNTHEMSLDTVNAMKDMMAEAEKHGK